MVPDMTGLAQLIAILAVQIWERLQRAYPYVREPRWGRRLHDQSRRFGKDVSINVVANLIAALIAYYVLTLFKLFPRVQHLFTFSFVVSVAAAIVVLIYLLPRIAMAVAVVWRATKDFVEETKRRVNELRGVPVEVGQAAVIPHSRTDESPADGDLPEHTEIRE
jgi:uncharacterized membrane protein YeaQ/YmgE (transglycosylase-associated protein family)